MIAVSSEPRSIDLEKRLEKTMSKPPVAIDNNFVVLALMEDLLHKPVPDPTTPTPMPAAATASTSNDGDGSRSRDDGYTVDREEGLLSAASPVDFDDEPTAHIHARCKALSHLPSLVLKMGRKWSQREVVPYLLRCAQEDELQLGIAVAAVMPDLVDRSCYIPLSSSPSDYDDDESVEFPFTSPEAMLPVLTLLCGSSHKAVREFAVDYTIPMTLLGVPFDWDSWGHFHSPQLTSQPQSSHHSKAMGNNGMQHSTTSSARAAGDQKDLLYERILFRKALQRRIECAFPSTPESPSQFGTHRPQPAEVDSAIDYLFVFLSDLCESSYPAHRACGARICLQFAGLLIESIASENRQSESSPPRGGAHHAAAPSALDVPSRTLVATALRNLDTAARPDTRASALDRLETIVMEQYLKAAPASPASSNHGKNMSASPEGASEQLQLSALSDTELTKSGPSTSTTAAVCRRSDSSSGAILHIADASLLVWCEVLQNLHLLIRPVQSRLRFPTALGCFTAPRFASLVSSLVSSQTSFVRTASITTRTRNAAAAKAAAGPGGGYGVVSSHIHHEHLACLSLLVCIENLANALLRQLEDDESEKLGGGSSSVMLLRQHAAELVSSSIAALRGLKSIEVWKGRYHVAQRCGPVLASLAALEVAAAAPAPGSGYPHNDGSVSKVCALASEICLELSRDCETEVRVALAESAGALPLYLLGSTGRGGGGSTAGANTSSPLSPPSSPSFGGGGGVDGAAVAQVVESLLEAVQVMVMDDAERVRSEASSSLAGAAEALYLLRNSSTLTRNTTAGYIEKLTVGGTMLLMDLINDECSVVQLSVIGRLGEIMEFLGHTTVEKELLALCRQLLAVDKWRVRHDFVGMLAKLCAQFLQTSSGGVDRRNNQQHQDGRSASSEPAGGGGGGSRPPSRSRSPVRAEPPIVDDTVAAMHHRFAEEELLPVLVECFFDRVRSVRDQALNVTARMLQEWPATSDSSHSSGGARVLSAHELLNDKLWPLLANHPEAKRSYLNRAHTLHAGHRLCIDKNALFFPLLQQLSTDSVVNVRMSVAKVCYSILLDSTKTTTTSSVSSSSTNTSGVMRFTDEEKQRVVLSLLRGLVEDASQDVRECASTALAACH